MANFRTKARAIDLLGKNQIADLPTAITELWKNGYDAYGDSLNAAMYKEGYQGLKHSLFTVSDDGHGMSNYDIINKWIVLGTDSKRNIKNSIPSEDRFGKEIRVSLGEKGIGRLSVTYLGDHMLMITKKQNMPYEIVFMNWGILNNYELYLDDINIPIDTIYDISELQYVYSKLLKMFDENFDINSWNGFTDEKEEIKKKLSLFTEIPDFLVLTLRNFFKKSQHGTYFIIFDPIEELCEIDNESDETDETIKNKLKKDSGYIRAAITALFNPLDEKIMSNRVKNLGDEYLQSPKFEIYKPNGIVVNFLKINEFFTIDEFEDCEHWIKGRFDDYGCFNGQIKVSGQIENYFYSPSRKKMKTKFGSIELKLAFWEGNKKNSSLSPVSYVLYEKKAELFGGFYVYRDGFRVLPYGRTDVDFLEFEFRRSKSAGAYYFSHRKMVGFIGITKKENPKLIDKAGREGFVSNAAYKEMKSLLMEFFIMIAKNKYGTGSENRKEYLEEKKNRQQRDKLLLEEQRKNKQEIKELRIKLKANEKKLCIFEDDINLLSSMLKEKIENRGLLQSEQRNILEKINRINFEMWDLKLRIPGDINFVGYDKERDMFYEYEEKWNMLKNNIGNCQDKVVLNTVINTLKDQYLEKYTDAYKRINSPYDEIIYRFKEKNKLLLNNLKSYEEKSRNGLLKLSPEYINIDDIDAETTIGYIKKLDIMTTNAYTEYQDILYPFITRYELLDFADKQEKLLAAYKSVEAELSEKVDTFYELAQVGMAIEIIDHQFNVLYEQITNTIRDLSEFAKKNSSMEVKYKALKIAFQHLESNHKMLMPLYRTTRRNKSEISGEIIQKELKSFFNQIFIKENITFECSQDFLNFSFFTFESIIMPVFINIVNNAAYWVRRGDRRIIRIEKNEKDEVMILNSGSKMSITEIERCFELFYTKKADGRGIGLYLAKRNLRSVGLNIYATNDMTYNVLEGACFVICQYDEGENG